MSTHQRGGLGAQTALLGDPRIEGEFVERAIAAQDSGPARSQALGRHGGSGLCVCLSEAPDDPEAFDRFEFAVERRAEAHHEQFAPLVAAGRFGDRLYMVYEVGRAAPLPDRLSEGGLPMVQWLIALGGVASALDEAHAYGFYAYELTPDSVFVEGPKPGLLADVGLAREALGAPKGGEPARPWLAPEVLTGSPPNLSSTVYSFGALLFAAQTGTAPDGRSRVSALRPDLPPAVDEVIARAMATDPGERFLTTGAVLDAAMKAVHRQRSSAGPSGRAGAALPRLRSGRPGTAPQPEPGTRLPHLPKPRAEASPPAAPGAAGIHKFGGRSNVRPGPAPAPAKSGRRPGAGSPAMGDGVRRARRSPGPAPRPAAARAVAAPERRTSRFALFAGAGAVLALCAAGGFLLGSSGSEEPQGPSQLRAEGTRLELPAGWERAAAGAAPASLEGADLLVAPDGRNDAGLAVRSDTSAAVGADARAVQLGSVEAWRESGVQLDGGLAATRYTIPTDAGALVLTCFGPSGQAAPLLADCENIAGTVVPAQARSIPVTKLAAERRKLENDVGRLAARRASLRDRLAAAERRAGQAAVALELARLYEQASRSLAPGRLVDRLAAASTSYRRMARAAQRGQRPAWAAAADQVDRREAAIRRALESAG